MLLFAMSAAQGTTNKRSEYVLAASNEEERLAWMESLRQVLTFNLFFVVVTFFFTHLSIKVAGLIKTPETVAAAVAAAAVHVPGTSTAGANATAPSTSAVAIEGRSFLLHVH